jgi:hypothetical protein
MWQAIDPRQLLVSTAIVASLYCVIYLFLKTWHRKIGLRQAQGLESLLFFLALDTSIATGRVALSCFIPDLISSPALRQLVFAVIAFFTLFGAIVSSQLQAAALRPAIAPNNGTASAGVLQRIYAGMQAWMQRTARPAVLRAFAWSVRAFFGTLHTVLFVGIPA